ncbi:ABC transporter ATP-binding protein [Aurantimonas sp. VKM B-3413]|uniref:ABC transporter ATP-binding protein n=1 Tax=Aurantimonas sp. VKM B-3413 TaxID=2779401 RepID=UPI001E38E474|nr:ABC transporter ATP-binding protein [Aurantimonas sp. VKM B-3413]MCB8836574.1 ABC transporter ATP-binding protein [Aurantimonas sp. VKM B-3413]
MDGLRLEQVTKRFGETAAVNAVSLDVAKGEFVALLGPSGCGKTTLLRLIAGFEALSEGAISVGPDLFSGPGRHMPPERRNVAIVFQSYALWPHMSVAQNVGYPLRVRGVSRADRDRKVAEALGSVDLGGFADRRPADLSGGQRQRVALARCLVMEPRIVLLDEPLANLDVALRASMEETFRSFHERTGATMVYVTHDQAEAMALADRVAVMERGRIVQCDAPTELYARPASEAVARFIGGGQVVPAMLIEAAGDGLYRVDTLGARATVRGPAGLGPGPVRLSLRAKDLAPANGLNGGAAIETIVHRSVFRGGHFAVSVAPKDGAGDLLLEANVAVGLRPRERLDLQIHDGWLIA